ncbi:MAG: hypothetical protein NDJ19_16395, partial [Ramlibacter sp.]|nr:hypothetical protein [Ramlibacter sp.]
RQPHQGPREAGAAYNAAAKFYAVYSGDTGTDPELRIDHVAIDFKHSSMADSGSWFPLPALRHALARGRVGALAARFHGVPTHRSQRHTLEVYCPEVASRCREDRVDVALLVPNCPVCHQTLALVARHLEAAGIATVVLGCAKDIVEHVGVPRLLFSDFPLGNAAGRPGDPESQALTLELALRVLESAPGPRTTLQSPLRWSESHAWKLDYSNADRVDPAELARLRAEFDRAKQAAKAIRASTA